MMNPCAVKWCAALPIDDHSSCVVHTSDPSVHPRMYEPDDYDPEIVREEAYETGFTAGHGKGYEGGHADGYDKGLDERD